MATQTDLAPTLDTMVEDGLPSQRDAALAIMQAVARATLYADGVTAATIRPEIPDDVYEQYKHHIGATISTLVAKRILTKTGRFALSGNRESGNSSRPMHIYHCDLPALKKYIDERSRHG